MSNSKGYRNEAELRQKLQDRGFAVLRTPASGSSTVDSLPDITAGRYGDVYVAIEAKRAASGAIYLDRQEIVSLCEFSNIFGTLPLVSGRWDQDTTQYVVHVHDLYQTDGGNYRVHHDEAEAGEYCTLDDLDEMMDRYGECGVCGCLTDPAKHEMEKLIYNEGYAQMCDECVEKVL